jgi:hypothetical protein
VRVERPLRGGDTMSSNEPDVVLQTSAALLTAARDAMAVEEADAMAMGDQSVAVLATLNRDELHGVVAYLVGLIIAGRDSIADQLDVDPEEYAASMVTRLGLDAYRYRSDGGTAAAAAG